MHITLASPTPILHTRAPKDSSETPKGLLLVTLSLDTLSLEWLNFNKRIWLAELKHVISAQSKLSHLARQLQTHLHATQMYTSKPHY